MRIPKKLKLGGIDIKVYEDNELAAKNQIAGKAIYVKQAIVIDPTATPRQSTEQAFLHELVHWILYSMGERDLMEDERFVDLFARFLHQAMEYITPEKGEEEQ